MWSRKELKTNAKAALKNYFGKGLLALIIAAAISAAANYLITAIFSLIGGVSMYSYDTISDISNGAASASVTTELPEGFYVVFAVMYVVILAVALFVTCPLQIGTYRFYQKSRSIPTGLNEIFVPMKKCVHIGLAMLLMAVKLFLWSLLFVIPGIIKAYQYSMVPYILAENPEISTKRAFQISKAMTDGHKFDLFVLELSFILWSIGVACTCGLLLIYVGPYVRATMTEAYYRLKAEAVAKGAVTLEELPDICIPAQPPVPPVPPVPPTAPTADAQ